jgi:transcriptional regulator with XRE-family HTH domain
MIILLEDAGFDVSNNPIFWSFATGFPKAQNISKQIDKRNGRKQETYIPFAAYLKEKRLSKEYSMKQMDEFLGTNTAYSWWEGRKSGIQLPRKEYYLQLKEILELDNRFDELIEREEAEREVIGTKSVGIKNGAANGSHEYGLTKSEVNITKDATPEAIKYNGAYAGYQPKPAVEVILVATKPRR